MPFPEPVRVVPVRATDAAVAPLLAALTAELAGGGYRPEQTFGYSAEQLERAGVHLVGAEAGDRLVGVAGVEADGAGGAELKRFYVEPGHRGSGVADALLAALVAYARGRGVRVLRLEAGDKQQAALRFYRRHGFTPIPRFGPYVDSATSVCLERALPAPPRLRAAAVTVGTPRPRELARFYAQLLGWPDTTEKGPGPGEPAAAGWAEIRPPAGVPGPTLAFEWERHFTRPVWPAEAGRPTASQHLDFQVEDLAAATEWALACGATAAGVQPQDDVRVLFDPDGHPFCLFR